MSTIPDYTAFFSRYRQFTCRRAEETLAGYSSFFTRVGTAWPPLMDAIRKEDQSAAPRFNVFRALHLDRKEVLLHTPMLGYLLDPTAAHGQGPLFLQAFLDHLRQYHGKGVPDADDGEWAVSTEVWVGIKRRLDVLIESVPKKCVIVIKNKIDTHDHGHQLRRYQKWIDKHGADWSGLLIYLTPDGRCPKKKSKCCCLSYAHDILPFLSKAMEEVAAPSVKNTVQQYCALIRTWLEKFDEHQRRRSRS